MTILEAESPFRPGDRVRIRETIIRARMNLSIGSINSLIQAAKAKAKGYRTNRNLITMAYLIAGKLEYDLPT